ncbi:helix-turn-helix transcriptional regulator [Nocardioides pyridinolyticus]
MSLQSHVVVTAEQCLIADTVTAALVASGLRVSRLPWLVEPKPPRPRSADPVDVGLMLSDLRPPARLAEAQRRVRATRVPWLVLTGAVPGPLWGAMLEAGAAAVLRNSATLEEVGRTIDRLLAGEPLMGEAEVADLVRAWHVVEQNRLAAVRRVRSLSTREVAVLGLMHAGESVQQIAAVLDVSESTVRSHVRSVLQKLGVKTQLAAVAEYELASRDPDRDGGSC